MFYSPREYYPLSWIYTEDEAATIIQRNVRGWLVRKRPEVQEVRDFWKALKNEKEEEEWKMLEEYRTREEETLDPEGSLLRIELSDESDLTKILAEIIQAEMHKKVG